MSKKMFNSLQNSTGGISIAIILSTLIACSQKNKLEPVAPKLHLACQTIQCECRSEKKSTSTDGKLVKIIWKPNGDASCPPGYALGKIKLDFLGRRK